MFPASDKSVDVVDTMHDYAVESGCKIVCDTANALILEDGAVIGVKCIDCRIEKSTVYGNIIDKSLHIAVIGKVTPSFARYHNFPADTLVLFDYRN